MTRLADLLLGFVLLALLITPDVTACAGNGGGGYRNRCRMYKNPGMRCRDRPQRRYYYDHVQRRCNPFEYGDCGGNGNNFYSHRECTDSCR